VIYGENTLEKSDKWTKNWIASMKWYGVQIHDVSTGKIDKNRVFGSRPYS